MRQTDQRKTRTVRELGGEYWAEISRRVSEEEVGWEAKGRLVEILLGVLARHEGAVIQNDEDLPVEPLDGTLP